MISWHIDADAHVTESADVWVSRLPAKWRDVAPRMAFDPASGEDRWFINNQMTMAAVGGTASGFNRNPLYNRPARFSDVPSMAWDAKARLEYMDSTLTWAQVIYPNVGGFGNQHFSRLADREVQLACVRAYNDWLIEWCGEDPRRLLPVAATPFWNIPDTVGEIQRCAAKGARGILFTGEPQRWGMPYFADEAWDPLWSVAEDTGLPISFHIGSGDMDGHLRTERAAAMKYKSVTSTRATVAMLLDNANQVVDFLLSGVLPRFPGLKVVSVESGAGWVPFALEAVDYYFDAFEVMSDVKDVYQAKPSEYFHRQMFATWFFERFDSAEVIESIGADNLMFETDFPHPSCLYADNVAKAIDSLAVQSEEVKHKLTWANAASVYQVAEPD